MPKIFVEKEKVFVTEIQCPKCTHKFFIGTDSNVTIRELKDKRWVFTGWQVSCPSCKYSFSIGLKSVGQKAFGENNA